MRKVDTYGTNPEVVALSAILSRTINIRAYRYKDPLIILHESVEHVCGPPLMISRHRDNRYNYLCIPGIDLNTTPKKYKLVV